MKIFNREPAVVIGIIAAAVLAVVESLVGDGVLQGNIGDTLTAALDPTGGWALPIIVGFVTRFVVFSPAKAAELKAEVPEGYVKA